MGRELFHAYVGGAQRQREVKGEEGRGVAEGGRAGPRCEEQLATRAANHESTEGEAGSIF